MGFDSNVPELDDYAVRLIKHKAWQLVGRAGFTKADREDIEQDLTVDLLHRLPQFNPDRGSLHTFIARVVDNGVRRLIEHRAAPMRDYRSCPFSLNDRIQGDEGEQAERGEQVDENTYLESIGQPAGPLANKVALQIDLEHLLTTLTPELRDLWARVADGQNFTEISRETGIPRGTLYDRMKQLRGLAERVGMRVYLESP
jgi:RNA polymerase sigma-70 factor (ECF subfamily)